MWMGSYTLLNLFGIFLQVVFMQNILLAVFLGMCTYLACSNKISTANGLGIAVVLVLTISGIIGSREFVFRHYRMFKDRFKSKKEKVPKPISGFDEMFSLKQLSEV